MSMANQFTSHKYNPKLQKAEEYILTNKPDSALVYLNQIKDSTYNTYISFLKKDIINQNITYKNLRTFLLTIQSRKELNSIFFYRI